MLEVRAIWTVGYPVGSGDKKIYSNGDVFECDEKFARKQARAGKVEIIQEAESLSLEDLLEEYYTSHGWYEIPGIDHKVRKKEAVEILKEKM